MNETLPDLIKKRIETAYGDNQAAFARAIGATQQTMSAWAQGKVSLPRADARRRLAQELGVSHVQLFVLAGELAPEEVGPQQPPPFPADDPRAAIVDALRTLSVEDAAEARRVIEGVIAIMQRSHKPTPIGRR